MNHYNNLEAYCNAFNLGSLQDYQRLRRNDFTSPGNGSLSPVLKYLITTDKGKFLQKCYRDKLQMPKHIDFLIHLKNHNFPSQHLISSDIHDYCNLPTLLFDFIPGTVHDKYDELDLGKINLIGETLSFFHNFSEQIYGKSRTIIHGDFHLANMVFEEDKMKLIDFDSVDFRTPIRDISLFLFYDLAKSFSRINFYQYGRMSQLLRGYFKNKKLNDSMLNRIPCEINNIVMESEDITKVLYRRHIISKEKVVNRAKLMNILRAQLVHPLFLNNIKEL